MGRLCRGKRAYLEKKRSLGLKKRASKQKNKKTNKTKDKNSTIKQTKFTCTFEFASKACLVQGPGKADELLL